MFGTLPHVSRENSDFHGILDSRNKDRFRKFIASLDPNKTYFLHEFDISGQPYHA